MFNLQSVSFAAHQAHELAVPFQVDGIKSGVNGLVSVSFASQPLQGVQCRASLSKPHTTTNIIIAAPPHMPAEVQTLASTGNNYM